MNVKTMGWGLVISTVFHGAVVLAANNAPTVQSVAALEAIRAAKPDMSSAGKVIYYDSWEGGVLRGGRVIPNASDPKQTYLRSTSNQLADPVPYNYTTIISNGAKENRIDITILGDGYTSSQLSSYASDVQTAMNGFFAESPLNEYAKFFNVHRVDVISAESGVDNDPNFGDSKNTALDMGYWCGNIQRLLCVDVAKALDAAKSAPQADQVLVLANSSQYGGAGYSGLGTLAGKNASSLEVALHEFGHSFALLADEYDYGSSTVYSGGEPGEANVSTLQSSAMATQKTKWYRWLGYSGVDSYEGAYYSVQGIYRPLIDSKMRTLYQPYGAVNIEQFIMKMYAVVAPIDDATPAGTYTPNQVFFVKPVQPATHALAVNWWVDGQLQANATGANFSASNLNLAQGAHTIAVRVVDKTPLVRDETFRATRMTWERTWSVQVGGGGFAHVYNNVYVRGTANGWAPGLMKLVGPNTWSLDLNFGSGTNEVFKFDIYANWATNFGDNAPANGVADLGGANIKVTQGAGVYRITFNDSTKAYSVVKQGGNIAPIAKAGNDQTVTVGSTVTFNGASSSDPDGTLSNASYVWTAAGMPALSGPNPVQIFSTAGTYTYTLTVTDANGASATDQVVIKVNATAFTKLYPQVYVRGTNNGFAANTKMSLAANNSWQADVPFGATTKERFKFDIYGDWTLNFGSSNGDNVADKSGADIKIMQGAGTYRIKFNDQTKVFSIIKI